MVKLTPLWSTQLTCLRLGEAGYEDFHDISE